MTELSKSEFARRLNRSPSFVTALAQAGRLVMSADGHLVDAEASERLIAQTGGFKPSVSERHAAARSAKAQSAEGAGIGEAEKIEQRRTVQAEAAEKIGSSRQAALAVKEKYGALRAKAEYEMLIGDLMPAEDWKYSLDFSGATLRALMDVFPDQNAPILAPMNNMDDVHAHLTAACTAVLYEFGAAIAKLKKQTTES